MGRGGEGVRWAEGGDDVGIISPWVFTLRTAGSVCIFHPRWVERYDRIATSCIRGREGRYRRLLGGGEGRRGWTW